MTGLAEVLRRYAYPYTAGHDFAVAQQIMVDDYVLRMGEAEVRGRDTAYRSAVMRQFEEYPSLGFTVHDVLIGTDRAALSFSEHGRSVKRHRAASWRGVSLYRWNGERLTECRVEQDYFSRARQLDGEQPAAVPPPGIDAWDVVPQPADPGAQRAVRDWLQSGAVLDPERAVLDAEPVDRLRVHLGDPVVEVLDLFSAGSRAAFHAVARGTHDDHPAELYLSGMVDAVGGSVAPVRIITDRRGLERRLAARA